MMQSRTLTYNIGLVIYFTINSNFWFPIGIATKSQESCITYHQFLTDNITLIGWFRFWNDIYILLFIWAGEISYSFDMVRTYSEIWRHRALPSLRRR